LVVIIIKEYLRIVVALNSDVVGVVTEDGGVLGVRRDWSGDGHGDQASEDDDL
jgi:hypothetical protein